jgi:hypothetical protein
MRMAWKFKVDSTEKTLHLDREEGLYAAVASAYLR